MIYLNVSQYIYEVSKKCDFTTFPLIADSGAKAPYAIYRRNLQLPNDTKDGIGYYSASYSVKFIANTYTESTDMLTKFTELLYRGVSEESGITVYDYTLVDAGEDWIDGYFILTINLTVEYNLLKEE